MHRVAMAAGGGGDGGDARGRTLGAVIKEKDDELALFLEMRRREKERGAAAAAAAAAEQLLVSGDGVGVAGDGVLLVDRPPPPPAEPKATAYKMAGGFRRAPGGADDFLNSDGGDKNDYDWLLTPPGTPLFPSLESESKKSPGSQTGTPKTRPTALKSRLANQPDPPSRTTLPLRTTSSNNLNSAATTRRPSSSGGHTSNSSRPSTPTGRPALTNTSKGSRPSTPTSRATVPSKSGPPARRSSTPTSRSTLTSARSITPSRTSGPATRTSVPSGRASAPVSRSSTPTRSSIPATRSSTPSSRPSIPAQSKPVSRSSTPTRRPSSTSTQHGSLAAPVRSSSISKPAPTISKSSSPAKTIASTPSRGSSPTVKSRPWKPSEMPGFSLDAPPNLRTSLPERPTSATRGRPGAPSSRSSSVESGPAARPRRQSCSPSRGRTLNGSVPSGSSMPAVRRSHLSNGGDSVNPVQMGNKMVERVVNMRRLVPPKHDDQRSSLNSLSGKSSNSPDSSGFGRTLSKKSLDMALRHMDIRRSIPNNLRPLMTSIPASSVHSARSGSTRSRPISVSDSPLATSSNASSEPSVNNNLMCLDSIDIDDELCSDRAGQYRR
ncbi:mucin-5AC [Oryza brachyantha]|nr:mucin-5AC [Oryza brachyantha]